MLHQVGVSFDLYYDARKHKIKISVIYSYNLKYHSFKLPWLSEKVKEINELFFYRIQRLHIWILGLIGPYISTKLKKKRKIKKNYKIILIPN